MTTAGKIGVGCVFITLCVVFWFWYNNQWESVVHNTGDNSVETLLWIILIALLLKTK